MLDPLFVSKLLFFHAVFFGLKMPINPFTDQGAFGPEATAAMGKAFDAACEELRCTSQPEVIRELIASLIVATARRGELDPIRLRLVAVAGFTIFRPRGLPASAAADAALQLQR